MAQQHPERSAEDTQLVLLRTKRRRRDRGDQVVAVDVYRRCYANHGAVRAALTRAFNLAELRVLVDLEQEQVDRGERQSCRWKRFVRRRKADRDLTRDIRWQLGLEQGLDRAIDIIKHGSPPPRPLRRAHCGGTS